jgi:hypothetical protein
MAAYRHATPAEPVPAAATASRTTWSAATRRRLAALTVEQRTFVEGYVGGLSGAEALRRATGTTTPADREAAYQLKADVAVAAALGACLADRNRADRRTLRRRPAATR